MDDSEGELEKRHGFCYLIFFHGCQLFQETNPYCLPAAKTELLTTTCLLLQSRFGCQTIKTTHLNVNSPFRASYCSQVS